MNFIYLKGLVKNIRYSHTIDNVIFNKADLIVKRPDGREDILILKFKQFCANLKEESEIELIGNIRSFSQFVDGRNKVEIYVFSYLDKVELVVEGTISNTAKLVGRMCKKDSIRTTSTGKQYIHFIVANNLTVEGEQRLNSYIPCVAWGKEAKLISNDYNVGDEIYIEGQLHSREYKKKLDNNEFEIRVAHELAALSITKDIPKDEI